MGRARADLIARRWLPTVSADEAEPVAEVAPAAWRIDVKGEGTAAERHFALYAGAGRGSCGRSCRVVSRFVSLCPTVPSLLPVTVCRFDCGLTVIV